MATMKIKQEEGKVDILNSLVIKVFPGKMTV